MTRPLHFFSFSFFLSFGWKFTFFVLCISSDVQATPPSSSPSSSSSSSPISSRSPARSGILPSLSTIFPSESSNFSASSLSFFLPPSSEPPRTAHPDPPVPFVDASSPIRESQSNRIHSSAFFSSTSPSSEERKGTFPELEKKYHIQRTSDGYASWKVGCTERGICQILCQSHMCNIASTSGDICAAEGSKCQWQKVGKYCRMC